MKKKIMTCLMLIPVLSQAQFKKDVYTIVDQYKNKDELKKTRVLTNEIIDECVVGGKKTISFSDVIDKIIDSSLTPIIHEDRYYSSAYKLLSQSNKMKVGLMSHRMCEFNENEMKHLLEKHNKSTEEERGRNWINEEVRLKAKSLVDFYNSHFDIINKRFVGKRVKEKSKKEIKRFYGAFFGCLAYAESLTNCDGEKSEKNYQGFVKDGYFQGPRPACVNFHVDRPGEFYNYYFAKRKELVESGMAMDEAKKLAVEYAEKFVPKKWPAIGLYQFASNPKSTNIPPCVKEWNKTFQSYPACQIEKNSSDYMRALSSRGQSFNAFCGVKKITQQFDSMVNTTDFKRLALGNRVNGKAVEPRNRCVSLFVRSGHKAFVHYGPLANSVPDVGNLNTVVKCTQAVLFN